ncbi:hypothetical protein QZH41_009044, partial [Actinostola sp. cb2023]
IFVVYLKRADPLQVLFSFTLYWRILPLRATSTGLERNKELQDNIKTKITRLQATDGRIIIKPQNKCRISRSSPKIVFKVKAAEALFISGSNMFIINIRANKVTCSLKGRSHSKNSTKRDYLLDMACLRLKLVFPKEYPNQVSFRYYGTRVRITKRNLKDVLWTVSQYKNIMSGDEASVGDGEVKPSAKPVVSHSNEQISKSRFAGSLGIQGVSVSDVNAIDPCIILGNDLITASWRCSFSSTHVYRRCLIFTAESSEILSVIVRPDYTKVYSSLRQDYSFLRKDTGKATFFQFGETLKSIMKEYCPRTQISTTLEGINVCLELDVFEKLAACTVEDIRLQCTRDAENLSCDFTVKDIEVEDRLNNVLVVRMSTTDGIQKRSLHAAVIQEATTDKRSVSFQQLYGELADFSINVEEEFLLKLLVFCGITTKKQLWGDEDEAIKRQTQSPPSSTSQSPPIEGVSLFFERLELSCFNVVCHLSPKQDLSEALLKLKVDLGIPNGLPPCVENARLDFERFLRTGIYYRSFGGLARDIKRHYLKEVGRQSAKILGSLHLLGNVTGLKDSIAEGLAELKETGNYMGFAGHVRNGLTESYYKLADSWSVYVKTPTKTPKSSTTTSVEEPQIQQASAQANTNAPPGLLSSLTNSFGGWVFSSQEEDPEFVQPELNSPLQPVTTEEAPPALCHTPPRDRSLRDCNGVHEEDCQSTFSMSCITTPTSWELVPREAQKQLKGQEFVRRLKQSMNDTDTEEKFMCCIRLRYVNPNDKLNALITSRKVYFMTVGSPSRDQVVLDFLLEKLYKAQEKDDGDVTYLELIMRMDGMQRLSLPSPNPGDNPLVRCDSTHLAAKPLSIAPNDFTTFENFTRPPAASRINKTKKIYCSSGYPCPCRVIQNCVTDFS